MNRSLIVRATVALLALAAFAIPSVASAKTYTVCKHGCKYRKIQKAVDASGTNDTVLVKPGTYSEGVIVSGKKHNGLTIKGTDSNPKKTILDGKNAHGPNGLAQNGIEGVNVENLTMENMWARNYATNGFFVRDSNPDDDAPLSSIKCRDYLMKNLVASFNRSYGLYAFGCIGGRITRSTGYGHGDSAFYIGGTPPQSNPDWTSLDHLDGHENVLGFSGTNSRYVDINHSNFYNNGVGVVPNTLSSEPYIPTATGKIRDNNIFWNNFNYFLPNSHVATVSGGLGTIGGLTIQYPTGIGIVLLGADGWEVSRNNIFGNFKYGAALVSNPLVDNDQATSMNNRFYVNKMGRSGTDTNGIDFFNDGSGHGNCFAGNASFGKDHSGSVPDSLLYPNCPAPSASGTGNSIGDPEQFSQIVGYSATTPPENQECSWTKHTHPPYKSYEPLTITPGPTCGP